MSKKIFAIGGGKESSIYKEMFQLSGIKKPELLLIPHAVPLDKQQSNYDRMYNLFVHRFGCKIKLLKSDTLYDLKKTREILSSADIIYVSEGNTINMIQMWKKYGFDEILKEEWEKGKLICGTSAGAVCWFHSFSTSDESKILKTAEGLNFINAYMTVHGQEKGAYEFTKQAILENNKLGILLTNGAAIEIIDDKYRIITSNIDDDYPFYSNKEKSYAIISFFQNNDLYEKRIYDTGSLEKLEKSLIYKR